MLQPYRVGIAHGGDAKRKKLAREACARAEEPAAGTAVGVAAFVVAAAGAPEASAPAPELAAVATTNNDGDAKTVRDPRAPAAAVGACSLAVEAVGALPPAAQGVCNRIQNTTGAGAHGSVSDGASVDRSFPVAIDSLRNKLTVMPPFEHVGSGSFGQVFKCSAATSPAVGGGSSVAGNPETTRTVAVKVCQKGDASMTAAFSTMPLSLSNELDALVKLQGHSGIVELLSWTETTFDVQFVFPLYKENAFAFLKRGLFRKQSGQPDLLRSVIKQLLRAIGHVHSRHILHRDLKPPNFLLADGSAGEVNVVISDFGSSTAVDPSNKKVGDTSVGTYQYRAPELFVAHPACSYQSDMWALGVCILQMDIMKMPFGRDQEVRRSQMFEVLFDSLRILTTWRKPQNFDYQALRQRPREFCAWLHELNPRPTRELPWHTCTSRGMDFLIFVHAFLRIRAADRPLAIELLKHAYLKGVA